MERILDLKKFNFECVRCGNCCYNVSRKRESGDYGYNFQGSFTSNPQVSVSIPFSEIPELKKNLSNEYNLELQVHPEFVLFMRDIKVGFIYQYQLGVKKKKYCRYYDIRKRECKIYPIRPSTCRSYPLSLNINNPTFPTIEPTCTGISNELKKQFPNMKEGEAYNFSSDGLINAFFYEFLLFQITNEFLVSQLHLILSNLDFIFLEPDIITPQKVEGYKLLDFSQFFEWAKDRIKEKRVVDILKLVRSQIEQLRIDTFSRLQSWKNNPNTIEVPFRPY